MSKEQRIYTGELTEIRKNQTGTGLLVEHDGYINRNSDVISQIREDMEHGHKFACPEHFVVSAVFQKYGIKNANGRIYPEDILKREVDKYIKSRVNDHNAVGALNHPACILGDTPILTEKGWKKIKDVEEGENILTLNPSTKKIEIKPILKKIESEYEGEMIRFSGRFINVLTTPNHKFPIFGRNKKFKGFYTAEELMQEEVPDQRHSYFFKKGEWDAEDDEYFEIPPLAPERLEKIFNKALKEKYSQPLRIPTETWMKFMGIYLSEGCTNGFQINIFQKKEEVCGAIEEMLDDFPLSCTKTIDNSHCNVYRIIDMRLAGYLQQFGICYDKYVPYFVKKQPKEMLRVFYDWFVMGDGRQRGLGPGRYTSDDVFSTSKQLVMDLNEIQLKIGYCGSYHEEDRHYDRYMGDRLIEGKNCQNMHFTYRCRTGNVSLHPKSLTITEEDYKGMVYCVEVENHTFYMMGETGKCLWTGNSSALDGHDVSHNILNLNWEGRTLVGDMELHLSPGYVHYGVCSTSGDLVANMLLSGYLIGVSSRGVGSVKELSDGTLTVCDDFELICWDVVLEPSTPNAWIKGNREQLEPYIENDGGQVMGSGPATQKSDDKIDRILQLIRGNY